MQRIAFVSGKARGNDGLELIERLCRSLRASGSIDRIVFSTWKSERECIERIACKLTPATVVYTDEPKINMVWNPLFQSIAWHAGLSVLDSDDIVLKFRTDRIGEPIVLGLAQRMQNWETISQLDLSGGYPKAFDRRILVPYFNPNFPFLIHDIEFVAKASDFIKLCNMDVSYRFVIRPPTTEGFFYASSFTRDFPLSKSLLDIGITILLSDTALRNWYTVAHTSPAWAWIWMTYLQIIRRYFLVGFHDSPQGTAEQHSSVIRSSRRKGIVNFILDPSPELGIIKHNKYAGIVASNNWWLDELEEIFSTEEEDYLHAWSSLSSSHQSVDKFSFDLDEESKFLRNSFNNILALHQDEPYSKYRALETEVVEY